MLQVQQAKDIVSALKAMVEASVISSGDKDRMDAFIQSCSSTGADADSDADSKEETFAPDADAYESKSGGIIDMLQDLMEKANNQLDGLRKTETDAANTYALSKQSWEAEIKIANEGMAEAKKAIAAASERKSMAEGELAATSKDMATDQAELDDVHESCQSQAQDFEDQ